MAFNSKLLNFYRTDSNAIFNIMFALLKVYENPGPNLTGIRDLRQCSNFKVQKRYLKQLQFESRYNKNGSHTKSVRVKSFKKQIRER